MSYQALWGLQRGTANALSRPPEEYSRKAETQMARLFTVQCVKHDV